MSKTTSARQKSAAVRLEQEKVDRRRRRLINTSIATVLVLLVAGMIGGAWKARQAAGALFQPDPQAAAPRGSFPADNLYAFGVPMNDADPGAPTVQLWEDFQCPACKAFEDRMGDTIRELEDTGQARVILRSTSFLDRQFPGNNSARAAAAFGCAMDAGKGRAYHDVVFANQPPVEGDGWTTDQLVGFGRDAGIPDSDIGSFSTCVTDYTYGPWAANGTVAMSAAQVGGTPEVVVNGEVLTTSQIATPQTLRKAITDAATSKETP